MSEVHRKWDLSVEDGRRKARAQCPPQAETGSTTQGSAGSKRKQSGAGSVLAL